MSTHQNFKRLKDAILAEVKEGFNSITILQLTEALLDPLQSTLRPVFWAALQYLLTTRQIHFNRRNADEQATLAIGAPALDPIGYKYKGWYHIEEEDISFWVPPLAASTFAQLVAEFRDHEQGIDALGTALRERFTDLVDELVPRNLLMGSVVAVALWQYCHANTGQ